MKKDKFRTRLLVKYAKNNLASLLIGLSLSLAAMAIDLIGPYIIGRILDRELVEGLGPRNPRTYIFLLGVYIGTLALASVLTFLYNYYFNKAANKVAMEIQKDVFSHIQALALAYYDKMPSGQIVSRITNDTRDIKELFRLALSQVLIAVIYALGVYLTLFRLDPRLAALGLVPLPLIIIIGIDFKNKAKKFNYSQRRNLARFNSDLKENIEGMDLIRVYNSQDQTYTYLDETNKEIYKDGLGYTKVYSYSGSNAMKTVQNLSLAAALFFFGYGSITGDFPSNIGLYYMFANYMTQLFDQLRIVVLRAGEFEKSLSAADHIFELLKIGKEDFGKKVTRDLEGHISFENVSFSYDEESYVLRDINIKAEPGQQIALVGQTGSGKSTIMNLLFGFYKAKEGTIKIDGMDLDRYDKRDLRRQMAIVLQDNLLFSASLRENINFFNSHIKDSDLIQAIKEVGGQAFLDKLEGGLDTRVKNGGDGFSSGEKQIISFARALVTKPKVLVLDEATANIDSETEAIIQEGIKALGKGRTMLIIAHRLSTIKHVDRIYVLSQGRVIEEGSHKELIMKNGVYKEMYQAQSNENRLTNKGEKNV